MSERAGDKGVIADVVERAYAGLGFSDHREHLMVERLRASPAFIPALSLLAQVDGQPAGHFLVTRALIRNEASAVNTLALAPLSVFPEFQGQGVGCRLVRAAHGKAAALGFGSVVLVGIPGFFQRFGYEPMSRYLMELPFHAPDANCMVLPLATRALEGVRGRIEYALGWLDH